MGIDASRSILLVTAERMPFGIELDADALDATLLSVSGFAHALRAMRSGFRPDLIIIDAPREMRSLWGFLRDLFDDPWWRAIPVLLAPAEAATVFQIAPRDRHRKLPTPSNAQELRTLIDTLVSDHDRGGARA